MKVTIQEKILKDLNTMLTLTYSWKYIENESYYIITISCHLRKNDLQLCISKTRSIKLTI